MKNQIEILGNWNEIKGVLKQRLAILTDDDILLIEGKGEEMLGRIQQKVGKTKAELEQFISEL